MTDAKLQAVRERCELDVASGMALDQAERDRLALVAEVDRLRAEAAFADKRADRFRADMLRFQTDSRDSAAEARLARAEADRMKNLALRLADRVAAQAELLSRRAERPT